MVISAPSLAIKTATERPMPELLHVNITSNRSDRVGHVASCPGSNVLAAGDEDFLIFKLVSADIFDQAVASFELGDLARWCHFLL